MNYGFIIDNRKCIGCHACTVACKAEHNVPVGVNRTWVKYVEKGQFPNTRRLFSVMRCNHCADAPCVEICPTTALHTRTDGIVDFDNRRCIACKACMQACPYDALFIDPETQTAAKCNYCANRVETGLQPSCVIVCPEHAIISGDLDNPESEISELLAREQVTTRKAEKGTHPKLFYIDGDEISLNPTLAEPATSYMWASQSSGVGHFAHFAQTKMAGANPEAMAQQLAGESIAEADAGSAPRDTSRNKLVEKARDVLSENVKRVYDAPSEGALWDWKVAAYVWTKAISAGAFIVLLMALKLANSPLPPAFQWTALGIALSFLLVTTALLVADLDQPKRFAYVLLRPNWSSWLVRGGYALAFYGALLTLSAIGLYLNNGLNETALWATAAFALLSAVYTAFLFSQAKGRDFWQSPGMIPHMLVHAVVAGAACLLIAALFNQNSVLVAFINKVLVGGLLVNAVVMFAELVTPHPTEDARRTVTMIVNRPFGPLFWVGGVIAGTALPVVLLLTGGDILMLIGSILALCGLYCIEYVWVRAPQLISLS